MGVTVQAPEFIDTVDQTFFIEPLQGNRDVSYYLEQFPEHLYTHSKNSNLFLLLYVLLGPAGVGWLQMNYLMARINLEGQGLQYQNLDNFFSTLQFNRIFSEVYNADPMGLVNFAQIAQINAADSSYYARAIDFLHAARSGTTPDGLALAATAGLGYPVAIWENYKYIYDQLADHQQGLPNLGSTGLTNEAVVLPQQIISKSQVQTISMSGVTGGSFNIYLPIGTTANAEATGIAWNATAAQLQAALIALPAIGNGNVICTGGPFPANVNVYFVGALSNQSLPLFQFPSPSLTGSTPQISAVITQANVDGTSVVIPPQDQKLAQDAMDVLRSQTCIPTFGQAAGIFIRQNWQTVYSDDLNVRVIRYVTGNPKITWPPPDNIHWIEAGIEHEAPHPTHCNTTRYINFHHTSNIIAYTEAALTDSSYESNLWPIDSTSILPQYQDYQVGPYSQLQTQLYPPLRMTLSNLTAFLPTFAAANPIDLPVVTNMTEGNIPLIQSVYPLDYLQAPGVSLNTATNLPQFWSSAERSTGSDFLEIDFGRVEGINFITFDATEKPYDIFVSYDTFDNTVGGYPQRYFIPVTLDPYAPSITSLGYNPIGSPSWTAVSINCTDSLGQMIYTRFIRIEFRKRNNQHSPFWTQQGFQPSSIEVKNLRIGRNLP